MSIEFSNPFSIAPGTVLGYWKNGKPFYVIAGGAPSDDEFDSKMDEENEEGEEEAEEEEETEQEEEKREEAKEDKKPVKKQSPEQEEIARLRQRLAKTRQESASRRKRLEEMSKAAETSKDSDESEKAVAEAKRTGFDEAENTYKPWVMDLFASNALLAAGIKPGKEKRALKLLDYDGVDFDASNRDITGIEDAVEELKEEWPELFTAEKEEEETKTVARVKSKDVNGAGRTVLKDRKPKTSTEQALERLIGRR